MVEKTTPKVIVIVGPTASGKTNLAVTVAKKFSGEVISADSRQVYRGLDLGTGKVTTEEMDGVPHHLLDVADPMETYTVSEFVRDGRAAVEKIHQRGKVPVIAGGSFFYIDSLLGIIETPEVPPNQELRQRLEKISTESLYNALIRQDPRRAEDIDPHNKRRLIRALEIVEAHGSVPEQASKPIYDTLTIGIDIDRRELRNNIRTRIDERIDAGMVEEVKALYECGMTFERMEELGLEYRYIARLLQGTIDIDTMRTKLEIRTWQFAKRQLTWLKRNTEIQWFRTDKPERIFTAISQFLTS